MDALKRPLKIPPSYPIYAEKHDINGILCGMLGMSQVILKLIIFPIFHFLQWTRQYMALQCQL